MAETRPRVVIVGAGFSAWPAWLVVHLIRLVVLINRAWDYLFLERASRIIIDR